MCIQNHPNLCSEIIHRTNYLSKHHTVQNPILFCLSPLNIGAFLYHGFSSSHDAHLNGAWKRVVWFGFNFDTYFLNEATGQPGPPVVYILPASTLDFMLLPPPYAFRHHKQFSFHWCPLPLQSGLFPTCRSVRVPLFS